MAVLADDVTADADEIGRVEHRLDLGQDRGELFGVAVVIEAEQRVGQHRPRRGAPASPGAKIVHQDVAKGERFEIAVAPAHRRFDDAVADREQAVARHGGVEAAATGEEWR